jgi:hypothetical protein
MIIDMNTSSKLKFILNNDELSTPYASNYSFGKYDILIWVFILKIDNIHIESIKYSYLVIGVLISDRWDKKNYQK